MKFTFDVNNLYEYPLIKICNPNKSVLGFLKEPHNLKISPTFNDITEMTFTMYQTEPNYDLICKYMVLHVEGFGYFIISEVSEKNDGTIISKEVECQSYEITLNDSGFVLYNEDDIEVNPSYYLYNPLSPETLEKSLLTLACNASNGWTVGEVDVSLYKKQRQFDSDSVFIYEFLMGDVQSAYGCYFVFDTENLKINVYDKTRNPTDTDILLSFDNLMKNVEITENSEDICTALQVNGADGVTINDINPLGSSFIYNFDYFKDSSKFMSEELIVAVNKWEQKIKDNTSKYDDLCTKRLTLARNYILLDAQLTDLESEKCALEEQRSVAIEANDNNRLSTIKIQFDAKEKEIFNKKNEIEENRREYTDIKNQISQINKSLAFKENFTDEQLGELKNYIKTGLYQNENFILTETIESDADLKVSQQQQLLEQAKVVFNLLSKPLYEFSLEVSNFLFKKEYQRFIDQIELGALVHAEIKYGQWVSPRLLKIEIDYENPESTSMTFSDNFRLQGSSFIFEDSYNETTKASNKVCYSASSWSEPIKSGFYNVVGEYINNAFDLAKQQIISTTGQDFQIGEYGIIGKKKLDENNDDGSPKFSDQQIRISNNLLTFTDDGWNTVKTAIGKVVIGSDEMYGVVAEALVGRLVAGEQLLISGETNSFTMTGSGCKITNAKLEITTSDNMGKIVLNPDLTASNGGISILGYNTEKGSWQNNFYVNGEGDIIANNIHTNSGTIGGWKITEDSLSDGYQNIIRSNGTGKLGLMTWNSMSCTFDGNIYADNLYPSMGDTTNIFTVNGGNVSMGGGWLTDYSVPLMKLDTLVCTQLYADQIVADYIAADKILADDITATNAKITNLEADYIKSKKIFTDDIAANKANIETLDADMINVREFLAEDGTFSGSCSWGTDTSYAKMWAENITSGNVNAYKLYLSAINGVEIQGKMSNVFLRSGAGIDGEIKPVIADNFRVDNIHINEELTAYVGNEMTYINAYGLTTHGIYLNDPQSSARVDLSNANGRLICSNIIQTGAGFSCSGNDGKNIQFSITSQDGNIVHFDFTGGILTGLSFN